MNKHTGYIFGFLMVLVAAYAVTQNVLEAPYVFSHVTSLIGVLSPKEISCTDTGNPDASVYSITSPAKSMYEVNGTDSDGCRIQLGETSVSDGQILELINVGSVNVTMSDEAGVAETAGTITLGAHDAASFRYDGSAWVEVSASNN